MTSDPTVSVVLPPYNRAHTLPRAIDSVLEQTFEDWELLVVDEGSEDDPGAVVADYQDPRIRFLRDDENRGAGAARNTGIEHARGELVAFLDSDDAWREPKLERQVRAIREADERPGLVYTGEVVLDEADGSEVSRREPATAGRVFDTLLYWDVVGSCSSAMAPREVLVEVGGFDESLVSREDWDLWLRIAREHPVEVVPDPLTVRYLGNEQISGDLRRTLEGTRAVTEKFRDELDERPTARAKRLAELAHLEFNYDRRSGFASALSSLRAWPVQPKLWAAMAAAVLGRGFYRWAYWRANQLLGNVYLTYADY